MIIDAHAHVTRDDYGGAALLRSRMDKCGIQRTVLIPGGMIDVRQMSNYLLGKAEPAGADIPNDVVEELLNDGSGRFSGLYCVNPHQGTGAVDAFRAALGRGFSGLKLAPMVHRFALTSPVVEQLAEVCGEFGVPFYSHVVGNPNASTDKMELLAARFPRTTFIIGHMGFGPADPLAIEIASRHENVFLETSGGSFIQIQSAFQRLGSSKLIFGSEFPMHHQAVELQKLELLASGREFDRMAGGNWLCLLTSAGGRHVQTQ